MQPPQFDENAHGHDPGQAAQRPQALSVGELLGFVTAMGLSISLPYQAPRSAHAFFMRDDMPMLIVIGIVALGLHAISLAVATNGDLRSVVPGALAASAVWTFTTSLGIVSLRPHHQVQGVIVGAAILSTLVTWRRCRLTALRSVIATAPVALVMITFYLLLTQQTNTE